MSNQEENLRKSPLSSIKKTFEEENKNKNNQESKKEEDNKETEKKEEKVENKKDELSEVKQELERTKETLIRTLAELDNTRRRAIEENEKTAKYAIGKFSEDLINVMENFYLAFTSLKDDKIDDMKEANTFFEGIKLTQNELKKVFEKHGIERIFPKNETFNPDLHSAITQQESEEDDGKILEVLQAGYKIKDRLLRPALVVVSKKKN